MVGEVGTGKTTLLNKICNSNEKTEDNGKSVTRDVFKK
jgi:predicted GTPase